MSKKWVSVLALCVAALGFNAAHAHGEATAKHGGVVQMSSDLSFELVALADGAALYIEDHDKPMSLVGVSGKLTVLNGAAKTDAVLRAVDGRLEAKGVKLASGSKAVASVITADKKAITVRFSVK